MIIKLFYYLSHRHIKKAWSPTIAVPLPEALALPTMLDRQREAHAEYKHTLVLYHSQGTRVRICIYANGVPK